MDEILEGKNSEFEELKSNYISLSESLLNLRDSISKAINEKIADANSIIEENINSIEEQTNEKYDKYVARLNSNLEQTLSLLMNDAKEYVQNAKTEIIKTQNENLDIYDNRIEGMKKYCRRFGKRYNKIFKRN